MKIPIFEKGERISRANTNNRLHYIGTNTPISDGGTGSQNIAEAVYRLGGYTRIVGYSSNSGTSSATLDLPQGGNNSIKEIGVYYGYGGIKRYARMPMISPLPNSDTYMPVALHYMTQGGNFVVRKGILYFCYGYGGSKIVKMLNSYDVYDTYLYSYYFSTDNEIWSKNEELLIYKVAAFY